MTCCWFVFCRCLGVYFVVVVLLVFECYKGTLIPIHSSEEVWVGEPVAAGILGFLDCLVSV